MDAAKGSEGGSTLPRNGELSGPRGRVRGSDPPPLPPAEMDRMCTPREGPEKDLRSRRHSCRQPIAPASLPSATPVGSPSWGDPADFVADAVRTDGALTLAPAAVTTLKALAADSKMAKLWKIISPGKKAAASGAAGSSSGAGEPPIDDALRKAVAAAAARAQVKADAVACCPTVLLRLLDSMDGRI